MSGRGFLDKIEVVRLAVRHHAHLFTHAQLTVAQDQPKFEGIGHIDAFIAIHESR